MRSCRQISCGESPPASAGANSAARPRGQRPRGTSRRLQQRFAAWPLHVPHNYLVFEFDVESLVHALSNVPDQGEHIFRRRGPRVDEEIRVAIADARIADIQALKTEFIDHPAR